MTNKIISMIKQDEEELSHLVVDVARKSAQVTRIECEFFGIDPDIPGFMCFMPRDEKLPQDVINCDDILGMRVLPVMKKVVKKIRGKDESKDL